MKISVCDVSEVFGRLTITGVDGGRRHCICECGNTTTVSAEDIRSGKTKSCGCLRKEKMTSHGMNRTRFYSIWSNMHSRCKHKSSPNYSYYGGRGIEVCENWNEFLEFKKDMYESYKEHVEVFGEEQTTLDRIDPDGPYKKENTRWATREEQGHNMRLKSSNRSGYVGVSWMESKGKWRSRATINGVEHHIGVFDRLEDAVNERKNFLKENV